MSRLSSLACLLALYLLAAPVVLAQGGADGAIQGTVTDQTGAVVPGAIVTFKSLATGLERAVSSDDAGRFRLPALLPGTYKAHCEMAGFTTAEVGEVIVNVGRTTDVNFILRPAGTTETVTVSTIAPLVETTKTDVGGVVEGREVANLPLNGRTFSSLAIMIPGARPVSSWDPTKSRIGAVSIAGGGGRNINTTIDGIDNKDNTVGGYVQNITLEGVQEFALKTQRFSAADGRSQGGLLSIVTKSGSNTARGSFFAFFRDRSLNTSDYFTKKAGGRKPDFSREQFGGSVGGPVAKDKLFFFFTFERLQEEQFTIIPSTTRQEVELLKTNNISFYGFTAKPASQVPQPYTSNLLTARLDWTINADNNAYLSWNRNRDRTENDRGPNDLTTTDFSTNRNELISLVWNSIVSPTVVNQFVAGYSYWNNLKDTDQLTPVIVNFPGIRLGTDTNIPQGSVQKKWQVKNTINWNRGAHGFKFGVDYVYQPLLGGFFRFNPVPSITFFHSPSTILTNKTLYPQGFATPGMLSGISAASGNPDFTLPGAAHMFAWFVQNDWKIGRKLTLNMGLRYDRDYNLVGGSTQNKNRTYLILKQIKNPITDGWVSGDKLPEDDANNFSPRIGFAYDFTGEGRTVIRGGYGLYYDQVFLNIPLFSIQMANPVIYGTLLSLANSSVGRGDLATFKLGDPIPPAPQSPTEVPNGTMGRIIDPNYASPMSQHFNIGFAHQIDNNYVLEVDYTHVLNTHESRRLRLNPRRVRADGTNPRVLEDAFATAGLPRNRLGDIVAEASVNRSRYDGLNIQIRKRLSRGFSFQVSYTLSESLGWAGSSGEFAATARVDQFDLFHAQEFGHTVRDERHRLVWSGIIDLPWGIQVAPIIQLASARPYTLTSGTDTNRDGITNDLCIPGTLAPNGRTCPSTVKVNSYRGGHDLDGKRVSGSFFWSDLRVTKFISLDRIREGMRIGLFFESFNLTNRMNFGNRFQSSNTASNFLSTLGMPTTTYGLIFAAPYQAQLGFRFMF